ncbi:MAG TPA: glycerophosphodiester phosphodiesterase family protein [Mycobacteriales bacterium]|nr:glycerophosphodiester phosphodiesterase family protein [Mycobacteriales bacterium]
MPTRFPFLDAGGPIAFAHRGAAPGGLENTFAAIDRVIALGYGYLETDVRATADGVAVLMHDAHLGRTTDRGGAIAALPYAEVAKARVGGTEPVPRLDQLLGDYPDLRVNLDVKAPSSVAPLVDAIRRTGAIDRVCVGSFHDRLLPAVRQRLGPRLCTSLGPRGILALRLGTLGPTPAGCAQVPPGLGLIRVIDRRFLAAAHRRGLPVHAWTINDRAEMERLLDLGVDGIMSDDAPGLRDVLRARRAWAA